MVNTFNFNQTALHRAASNGHCDVMKELLDSKADVNVRDKDGFTQLHWAAVSGNPIAVKTCLSYGADVNARENNNLTALQLASSIGHSKVMMELQVILTWYM